MTNEQTYLMSKVNPYGSLALKILPKVHSDKFTYLKLLIEIISLKYGPWLFEKRVVCSPGNEKFLNHA